MFRRGSLSTGARVGVFNPNLHLGEGGEKGRERGRMPCRDGVDGEEGKGARRRRQGWMEEGAWTVQCEGGSGEAGAG